MAGRATKSKKAVSKKSTKRPTKKHPKKKKTAPAKKSRVAKKKPAKKAVAKRAAAKPQANLPEVDFNNLVDFDASVVTGPGANQKLLDQILGGHYGDDTNLDPPYDGPARAGLAARIQRAGVPVSSATVMACTKVGCVRKEMNRVNPGGR
jgi:hypothetical protein